MSIPAKFGPSFREKSAGALRALTTVLTQLTLGRCVCVHSTSLQACFVAVVYWNNGLILFSIGYSISLWSDEATFIIGPAYSIDKTFISRN